MTIRFDGRVVIITGAGQGLGRAHALAFAKLGAKVVVNDLGSSVDGAGRSSAAADAVVAEIAATGGEAIADRASVTDPAAVACLVERTLARFGRIDVLVANAGILRDRSFHKMSVEEWQAVNAVHLDGTFHATRAVYPVMREAGYGRIVFTTSSSGLFGNFGQANYGAAKLGIVGLMRTLAIEGEKTNVRVNAIAPIAWTRMTAPLFPPGTEDLFAPEKVTPGVLFLASESAPTATVLSAGGGVFAVATMIETQGVKVSDSVPTADDIAAHWDVISDVATGTPLANGSLQTLKFLQRSKGG